MLIVALALQAVPQVGGQQGAPGDDLAKFDLAKAQHKPADNACGDANPAGDIVVWVAADKVLFSGARRKMMDIDTSRMPAFAEKPVRSVVDLPGGAKAGVSTTSRDVGGFTSKVIRAKVKIPF